MENNSHLPPVPSVTDLRQATKKHIAHQDNIALNASTGDLLQELRLHQVELEMQNEELRHTQLALEESLNRYVSLYEFSPVGYLTLTENGTIVEANLVSADLLGENRSALIKQRFPRFIVPEDNDRWHQHFYCVIQHGKNKSCEVRICRADGTLFYAKLDCLLLGVEKQSSKNLASGNTCVGSMASESSTLNNLASVNQDAVTQKSSQKISTETVPTINTNGLVMRVALTDITELRLAEQELRVAATVFESQEGMMVTDVKNVILKVNHAFTHITGYSTEEVVGKTPHLLSSGRHDAEFYKAMWARLHSTDAWQGEIWNRRKNGEISPEWLTITAVKSDNGAVTHYVATFTDITARKAAEDEMQLLAFYDPLTRLPNRRYL